MCRSALGQGSGKVEIVEVLVKITGCQIAAWFVHLGCDVSSLFVIFGENYESSAGCMIMVHSSCCSSVVDA